MNQFIDKLHVTVDTISIPAEKVGHAHVHDACFKNVSREPMGYNTKTALMGFEGAHYTFG